MSDNIDCGSLHLHIHVKGSGGGGGDERLDKIIYLLWTQHKELADIEDKLATIPAASELAARLRAMRVQITDLAPDAPRAPGTPTETSK